MDSTDIVVDIDPEKVIEHFGVKGMKWGVRNDKGHEGERAKTKKIGKLDKQFEKNVSTLQTTIKLHNRAAELSNADLVHINNKPAYKGQDFRRDSPLRQKYYKEAQENFLDNLQKAADEFGTNASGTKKYSITDTGKGWEVFSVDVKHQNESIKVIVSYDENGHIVKLDIDENVIEHFGVKGMKWGVRRKPRSPGSEDFQRHTTNKKAGIKNLSDKDLQALVNRMNMEQSVKRMNPSAVKKGHGVAKGLIAVVGTASAILTISKTPTGQALGAFLTRKEVLQKSVNLVGKVVA